MHFGEDTLHLSYSNENVIITSSFLLMIRASFNEFDSMNAFAYEFYVGEMYTTQIQETINAFIVLWWLQC